MTATGIVRRIGGLTISLFSTAPCVSSRRLLVEGLEPVGDVRGWGVGVGCEGGYIEWQKTVCKMGEVWYTGYRKNAWRVGYAEGLHCFDEER